MLRKRFAKVAFAVATALAMVGLSQAQASATSYGPYYLVDQNSGKCIDNPHSSTANVTMDIYTCLYTDNEAWENDSTPGTDKWWIRNSQSRKCLTVLNASTANNQPVIQYDCTLGTNEVWYYDYQNAEVWIAAPYPVNYQMARVYKIRNAKSGKCLTVKYKGTANNSTLLQYDCNTNGSNLWLQGEFY